MSDNLLTASYNSDTNQVALVAEAYQAFSDCLSINAASVPSHIAPTGTMAANGAVTLGTALEFIYSSGCYIYFPAGAVYAGSAAGSYYCVMSTTAVGTVYNNTLGNGLPVIPSIPTPIVAAGPGAFTGVITEITLATLTIPANLLSAGGSINLDIQYLFNNSVGVKTFKEKLGGTIGHTLTATTTVQIRSMKLFKNRGAKSSNYYALVSNGAATAAAPNEINVNTAASWTYVITGQLAAATDRAGLESLSLLVSP